MRLIDSHEGLCSENTLRELCGFTPAESKKWKIYVQNNGGLGKKGNFIEPAEHFRLVHEGPQSSQLDMARTRYRVNLKNTGREKSNDRLSC